MAGGSPVEKDAAHESAPALFSPQRIILFGVLTQGLYFFYWFYLTWKQLAGETREQHYPVWHAFSLLVPVYGLFRAHKHLSIIEGMAANVGRSPLPAGTGIVMLFVSNLCGGASLRIEDEVFLLILGLLSTTLVTVIMASYQEELNAVWVIKFGSGSARVAPTGVEAALGAVGAVFWVSILLAWV